MVKKTIDFTRGLLLAFLSILALAVVFPRPATCCGGCYFGGMEVRNDGTRLIVIDSVALFDQGWPIGYDEDLYVAPHSTATYPCRGTFVPDSAKVWYYASPESILITLISPVRFGLPYPLDGVESATVTFLGICVPEATPIGLTLAAVALALTGVWFQRKRFLRAQGGLGPTAPGTGG
jgi:hypothetical protein